MDDPAFKSKYKRYKYAVKVWEHSFKKTKGRIPSKYDIREASTEVRHAYKMYYKMKTSILEDTLGDIFLEDGCEDDALNTSQTEISQIGSPIPSLNTSGDAQTPNVTLSDLNLPERFCKTPEKIRDFEAVENIPINENAWIQPKQSQEEAKGSVVEKLPSPPKPTMKLNTRLFATKSFSLKNPRKKSVDRNLIRSNSQPISSTEVKESLSDLETILMEKARNAQNNVTPKLAETLAKPRTVVSNIDQGWLNRCVLGEKDKIATNTTYETKKFGLSNINLENIKKNYVVAHVDSSEQSVDEKLQPAEMEMPLKPANRELSYAKNTCISDSDSVVSNSEDESAANATSIRHVIKKRRIYDIPTKECATPVEAPKPVKETVNTTPSPKKKVKRKVNPKKESKKKNENRTKSRSRSARVKKNVSYKEDSGDENGNPNDDVYEFDSDQDHDEEKVTRKSKTKKSKKVSPSDDNPPEITPEDIKNNFMLGTDRIKSLPRVATADMAEAETTVQNYLLGLDRTKVQVEEYDDVSSEQNSSKLKKKNINENFVTLNLRKKIFVRGHKHMNFSRYKKKLWKQKKADQEMDMRGCDGGMLTCFKCGNTGHFARNCKFKDDELLAVDAVDESSFPTLEEAEKMASEKAFVAHSRNIEKLPSTSNSLLFKDVSKDETDDDSDDAFQDEVMESEDNCMEEENTVVREPSTYIGHKIPEDFLKKSGLLELTVGNQDTIEPIYKIKEDGTVLEPTDEVYSVLRMFGHTNFRKGQERAIMRILSGVSTLVTLNTGSGKSLCYQLPAYLYSRRRKCITIVVSPLVSLMEDQVHGVPSFINAQCLHTNQTQHQKEKVMEMIKQGKVEILLVSPEAIVAGERSTGFGSLLRQLPPIAFACIDEVHCVSQWSHNFRPSYLMICKVLKQKLGVQTILGLTATATVPTKMSIIRHLGICDSIHGVISDSTLPSNLILSVSKDENRDNALINLLKCERFADCHSIIVYCTRRDDCERMAGLIRTCFQDARPNIADNKKRKRVNWNAEPYHAGLPASRRRTIQNAFMKNELRIVVATIAFGMGINKPDIRGVIHYNMPKSFESYVQEVGRAGRDGKIAHCHLFLDSKGGDQCELSRFVYANSIDRHVIRKLLQNVFIPCSCRTNLNQPEFIAEHADALKDADNINWNDSFEESPTKIVSAKKRVCPGHETGFSIEKTVEQLDIPEENISTLLCYLELDGQYNVKLLSNAYCKCKVISYTGSYALKEAAKQCPPLAMAIAIELKKKTIDDTSSCVEFSTIEVAAAIGWDSGVVKYQLKNLEWQTVNGLPKRSSISVTYFDLGFRLQAPGDLTDDELDSSLDTLYKRSVEQETTQLMQLDCVFKGLSSVAFKTFTPCGYKDFSLEASDNLKRIIQDYFETDTTNLHDVAIEKQVDTSKDDIILGDVRTMINLYPENNFTGRTLARIFHGIQSPNYPAVIWGRCKYWRAHTKTDFNHIVHIANSVIVKMRM